MTEQNQEKISEEKRIKRVQNEIDKIIEKLKVNVSEVKNRVIELRKNFWEDVTVNLDEPDDVIETQASIKQQAELLSERERSHGQWSERLKTLDKLKNNPYFGRIDFLEDGEEETDRIYIGISSLMDANEENFLIYDWRAPISSMYYDYPPGRAEYETMDDKITGEIKLKRQFIIRNGKLEGMFNTGITIGDHLLQSVLGQNASETMESIVATIQKEQNQIIRNEDNKILVVQGVAGSGKTSAALQRVAYLLYRHRQSLTSENILLFSPNPLFNSYVANVLPELGEANMKQTTFQEYIEKRLRESLQIETPFEQMEHYLTTRFDGQYDEKMTAIHFKSSLTFKQLMDDFINYLSGEGIQFRNITFKGRILITKEEIYEYFYSLDSNVTIANRMDGVRDWILERLSAVEKTERQKDWVLSEIELLDKEEYVKAFQELDQQKGFNDESFDDFEREEQKLRKWVVQRRLNPLRRKIKRLQFVNVRLTYMRFYQEWSHQQPYLEQLPREWGSISGQSIENLSRKFLSWEEVTPYLYVHDHLLGSMTNRGIRHVFIDEAQDYSPFQFAYLKDKFPNSQMTVLGDVNQAIYAHALLGETVIDAPHEEKMEKITLTKSYRSTKPIVEFTKHIVDGGDMIEPFNRDGKKPLLKKVKSENELSSVIPKTVHELQAKGYETIAIICHSMQESKQAYLDLKAYLPVTLIDEKTTTFEKGLIIVPTYLAKGIEFDAVVVYNASQDVYQDELERNLFYTACTRAMHELVLMSAGEPSNFIQDVQENKYNVVNE
ncbi:DNA helicase-2 / ATP-dependent DNA helicase PcrA [Salinibacillus kushneri]|uniref:DNA helicase-2 / ATP-dependent DNA helicase PcrA n=1 Tax=Salinibacillus kushneri TaxID=237682 RepID=A0A1I0CLJ5_9BACI|nr:RNA polymerase recycling motor HelD [Salinibacillus kushneri]SET20337.1 DNA helicase-2 / ATP-dependent DNA helicase PcrA [Salinibacillus kushneri]